MRTPHPTADPLPGCARQSNSFPSAQTHVDGLSDIARKRQLDEPIRDDTHLALQARQLAQVDATPQQPGEESRKAQALDLGARRVMTHDTQRSECIEMERP